MKQIFSKTFGGVTPQYYFRQFCFGLIFPVLMIYTTYRSGNLMKDGTLMLVLGVGYMLLNTLLYPYARFVYESIIGFILGNNTIFMHGIMFVLAMFFKIIMMAVCWVFAIFIAPVGLIYLYFYHTKEERKLNQE